MGRQASFSTLVPIGASLALMCAAGAPHCGAHEFSITPVAIVFAGDGTFRAEVGLDADALALGLPLESDSELVAAEMAQLSPAELQTAIEGAIEAVRADIRIRFDSEEAGLEVEFPHHGTPAAAGAEIPTVLGTVARITGSVPSGAREVTFQAAPQYKTVSLEVVRASATEPYVAVLDPGQASPAVQLAGHAGTDSERGVFASYLRLGFTHIVPKGLDHILFVLGLYLLSTRWRPLLYQVTAFTVAHSVTLGLSMYGIVSLPGRLVETLIALSISWVAIENIATSQLKAWRISLVFCFGLLHGLGFAGVLGELGMPAGRFATALLSFNLGVEAGQLAVVALAFLVTGRFRKLPGYRRFVVIPVSGVIAAIGLWWSITRAFEWG